MSDTNKDLRWLDAAKEDTVQWGALMVRDADGNTIDWDWVASLDLAGGIGAAAHLDLSELTDLTQIVNYIAQDYATRTRVEAVLENANNEFMSDFDRRIDSYRLPRALAYANRRLNDEIDTLLELGVREHLWTITQEWQNGTQVRVLHAVGEVSVRAIQDPSAKLAAQRARIRQEQREQQRQARTLASQASFSLGTEFSEHVNNGTRAPRKTKENDWRRVYLPGRDVSVVMGIDIETTGINPFRNYIIDAGLEYMDMSETTETAENADYAYTERTYATSGAYGQSRLSFGVPMRNAELGNPFIYKLTGIDVRERAVPTFPAFDEWDKAQAGLLKRLEAQPYVAHNASFEHKFFMHNVAGYAEAYRNGEITIMDTMPMSRLWDPGSVASEEHPFGDNSLEAYAIRWGALESGGKERHLGLEDAHIMLLAMRRHLADLKTRGEGPWGRPGISGVGGKHCRRR